MRIVIFGTGKIYQECKENLNNDDEIIAFLDNSADKWGKKLDGVLIYKPQELKKIKYDKIVLMSKYASDMKNQLIQYGYSENEIMHCDEYFNLKADKQYFSYLALPSDKNIKKHCAIICKTLGYHGGAIAAFYTALALKDCGIKTDIITETADAGMISEINKNEISVIVVPTISMIKWEELQWLEKYDYIIVNTMPMILCAMEIAKYRNVIMWLHESDNIYEYMNYWRKDIIRGIDNINIKIYAVSNVAKRNFCNWITDCQIGILPCGIPNVEYFPQNNKKLIFATIGSIHPIKGQDILVEAIKQLPRYLLSQVEFWIIGKASDADFYDNLCQKSKKVSCIKILGEIENQKMNSIYSRTDIVIIPSRKETLSLVAIEAMQAGNVCIVSDSAGIAEYIEHGKNGLLFKSEATDKLTETIQWCIENKTKIEKIKENAKDVYKRNFSMEILKRNLKQILQ